MPDEIKVIMPGPTPQVVKGKSGLDTQLPGVSITADAIGINISGDRKRTLSQIAIDNKNKLK